MHMKKKILTLMLGTLLLLTACGQTGSNSASTMLPVAAVQSATAAIAPVDDKVQENAESLLVGEDTEEAEPAGDEETPKPTKDAAAPSGKTEETLSTPAETAPPAAPKEPAIPAPAPEDKPTPAPTPAPAQKPAEKQEEDPAPKGGLCCDDFPVYESQEWLKSIRPEKGSKLEDAVRYSLNQKQQLMAFLDYGDVPISNNLAENAIRPFVAGRKNWLFCGSVKGAESSAIVYSLVETAKANDMEPYGYLLLVLSMLRYLGNSPAHEELEKLMPWHPAVRHREHIRK